MSFSAVQQPPTEARINITPLVDVMLVLLVIFMIATPLLSKAIPYTIPQPGPGVPTPREPIALRIDADGGLTIDGQPVGLSDLRAVLADRAATDRAGSADAAGQPPLWIDADDDSDYDTMARVLAAAHSAKITGVGFVRR